ncbi:AcylCoA synthetase bubblegum family member 2, partial [Caligus rogercresseyi]
MGMDRPPFSSERIMDANGYVVSRPNGAVLMRRNKKDIEPLSVPSFVKHHCLLGGNQLAMAVKRNGDWMRWTYNQYYMEIRLTAKGFIRLGLEPHHTVCIYGFNCPEWHIADLGAIFAGGFATGLYPTNSGPTNEYLMNNSRCQILVVENNATLRKVKGILSRVTTIKKVVVIEEEGFTPEEGTILWKDLLKMDYGWYICEPVLLPDLYGVMLSHDNITFTASALVEKHDWKKEVVVVSYLPLSHIAANMLDIFVVMRCRGQVFFADKSALKGSLVDSLREVQPTLFFGVPRIYE